MCRHHKAREYSWPWFFSEILTFQPIRAEFGTNDRSANQCQIRCNWHPTCFGNYGVYLVQVKLSLLCWHPEFTLSIVSQFETLQRLRHGKRDVNAADTVHDSSLRKTKVCKHNPKWSYTMSSRIQSTRNRWCWRNKACEVRGGKASTTAGSTLPHMHLFRQSPSKQFFSFPVAGIFKCASEKAHSNETKIRASVAESRARVIATLDPCAVVSNATF